MKKANEAPINAGRRDAVKTIGVSALAATTGTSLFGSGMASAAGAASSRVPPSAGSGAYNILFIFTDQERFFRPGELPQDYRLPAHERLAKKGIVFENHQINSCVCTPSRSVLYTGRHIQHTKMFDNTYFPWISSMSTDIPTIGHMLRAA